MIRVILIASFAVAIAGCSSATEQSWKSPTVDTEMANSSKAKADQAMKQYFACLHNEASNYPRSQVPQDIADAALLTCDVFALRYKDHMTTYLVALRLGHPYELEHGQSLAKQEYNELVNSGRQFVVRQAIK